MTNISFARMAGTFVLGLLFALFIYVVVIEPLWQQNKGGPVVMRTYTVNADYADEVRSALQGALLSGSGDKEFLGRVTLAPNGQLIVTAPQSMQKGIESLLNDIAGFSPGVTPSVKLEAWFVSSVATDTASPQSIASLNEIQPALAAIADAQGVQRFKLIEKMTVHVRTGQSSVVSSANGIFEVRPSVRRGSGDSRLISAELKFQMRGPESLRTETELKPGELLVLGQTSIHALEGDKGVPSEQRLYYIVRATL